MKIAQTAAMVACVTAAALFVLPALIKLAILATGAPEEAATLSAAISVVMGALIAIVATIGIVVERHG